jgi:hypothetical protein
MPGHELICVEPAAERPKPSRLGRCAHWVLGVYDAFWEIFGDPSSEPQAVSRDTLRLRPPLPVSLPDLRASALLAPGRLVD